MGLPVLLQKLFKNSGYGPEIKDERLSTDITVKDWDASHDYPANVLAKAGGDIYRSVAASGPGTSAGAVNPTQDASAVYWEVFGELDAAALENEIQTKVSLDGSNASSIGGALSAYMAHAAMPSGRYEVLTLPASFGTFTAAADGWLYLHGNTNNQAATVSLHSDDNRSVGSGQSYTGSGNVSLRAYIPVSKGTTVTVQYTTTSNTELVFIYANGSAPA